MTMRARNDFYRLTGIMPLRRTNAPGTHATRLDTVFQALALRVFDTPRLLDLLVLKLPAWLAEERSEFTLALAGYVFYLRGEFVRAERYFLQALSRNPSNLDTWHDLAFSLYHQTDTKHRLAKTLLLNCERYSAYFTRHAVTSSAIRALAVSMQNETAKPL